MGNSIHCWLTNRCSGESAKVFEAKPLIFRNLRYHLKYTYDGIGYTFRDMLVFINRISKASVVHYGDVIMGTIASQITSLTIVYSNIYSDADQRKHQSSVSLAFVWGIYRGPVNSPHKWPVKRKMFPFDDVIMVFFRNSNNFSRRMYWYCPICQHHLVA